MSQVPRSRSTERPPGEPTAIASPRFDPVLVGTFFSAISALGYTAANICLRDVAETVDPVWVSCIKAVPAAVAAWLLIARRAWLGQPSLPGGGVFGMLLVTGLCMQVGGNVGFQWSLGMIGLSLCVPLVFGTLLIGSAAAGRIWLAEAITPRSAVAMLMLVAAVGVLSWGAGRASHNDTDLLPGNHGVVYIALAVAAACLAGVAYAACNVVIRRTAGSLLPLSVTLMVLSTSGVVSLGLLSLWRIGAAGMASTAPEQWTSMILAGVFNAVAFFSLGIALQATTVTHTNLVNASQVAMSAIAGIILFGEPVSAAIVVGIALTVLGLALVGRRKPSGRRRVDEMASQLE